MQPSGGVRAVPPLRYAVFEEVRGLAVSETPFPADVARLEITLARSAEEVARPQTYLDQRDVWLFVPLSSAAGTRPHGNIGRSSMRSAAPTTLTIEDAP